jgi:DNA recombination-dependent growth factor C
MPSIRRSGGAVAFFWQGKMLDPRDEAFAAALQQRRFRTIQDAASEEVSTGWVTAVDPTGDSFAIEDLDAGLATWLRMRIDKKQLPRKWLQIHRDVAEKAKGKKLSAKERRELKDDLMDKLLPRVLPTINMVDALLYHDRRTLILLNTSKSVGESFHQLFFQTFQMPLEKSDPLQLGFQAGLDPETMHKLQRAEPIRWPKSEPSDEPRRRTTLAEQEQHA